MRTPAALSSRPSARPEPRARTDASLKLALRLGPVVAERVELGRLMQEAGLRRDRDDGAAVRQQDRLAKLPVPVAQAELLALVRGDAEVGALDILDDLRRIG